MMMLPSLVTGVLHKPAAVCTGDLTLLATSYRMRSVVCTRMQQRVVYRWFSMQIADASVIMAVPRLC